MVFFHLKCLSDLTIAFLSMPFIAEIIILFYFGNSGKIFLAGKPWNGKLYPFIALKIQGIRAINIVTTEAIKGD